MHLERIARGQLFALTAPNKRGNSEPLILPPSNREPEESYTRIPISYSILDSVGHCFQVNRILT